MSSTMNSTLVKKIAQLAQLPVTDQQAEQLVSAFDETLATVNKMKAVDVSELEPTHQVTGLENVLRKDEVDHDWMLTQEQALSNTKHSHNGFFVVARILDND